MAYEYAPKFCVNSKKSHLKSMGFESIGNHGRSFLETTILCQKFLALSLYTMEELGAIPIFLTLLQVTFSVQSGGDSVLKAVLFYSIKATQ